MSNGLLRVHRSFSTCTSGCESNLNGVGMRVEQRKTLLHTRMRKNKEGTERNQINIEGIEKVGGVWLGSCVYKIGAYMP